MTSAKPLPPCTCQHPYHAGECADCVCPGYVDSALYTAFRRYVADGKASTQRSRRTTP